ncbi:hypothetical protein [Brevibacillus agri]|uniref:hypothetical protein n=1 Tax=Brevibacillus agri TaxID=51101 RepID=UPI003D1D9502
MLVDKELIDTPIATLGPSGTDAEHVARSLSNRVILCESFNESMEYSYQNNVLALICCGYIDIKNGVSVDGWVDLNFRYLNKMEIVKTFDMPTKPICIAKRFDCIHPKTLVLHPATKVFADKIPYNLETHYVNNKPTAVKLVDDGKYDMCIGSLDVVQKYNHLEVLETFQPKMIWALYQRCDRKENENGRSRV